MSEQQPTEGVIPAPTGITANFENPERKHDTLAYTVSSVGLTICTSCVVMRIYAKIWVKRTFGMDDGMPGRSPILNPP